MKTLDQYLATVKPEFEIQEGDYIVYRRHGLLKPWVCKPRIGEVKGVTEDGMDIDVDYPSKNGPESEIVSVFQIMVHCPMGETNEGESSVS